jgi:hypothetical protein
VSWEDPSSLEVRTEHGANLLAAFALPLFPVIPTIRRTRTTGFNSEMDEPEFVWPLWVEPHSIDSVRSLLQLNILHEKKVTSYKLNSYGVSLAYRVCKFEVGTPPLSKLNLCAAVPK